MLPMAPDLQGCVIGTGLPGALPVLNRAAVGFGVLTGLVLELAGPARHHPHLR